MSDPSKSQAIPKVGQAVIRLGYIGCGFMAQNVHLPNFSSLRDCRLVALAENRGALGEEVAKRYRIPKVYRDHRQLLEEKEVDAVAVSADYAQQGEIAADFLRAGKHVFMEKPMAVSVEQAERILQAAEEGRTRVMVAYMKRYDPGNRMVRRTIRKWKQDCLKGKLLLARTHGFCGNWIAELDTSAMIQSAEPIKPVVSDALLPKWLPAPHQESYVAYLQQYTHNVNLLRFFLDISRRDQVEVRNVDLDTDGYTGLVTLQLDGRTTLMGGPAAALDIAARSHKANVGIVMDTFHFYRSQVSEEEVRAIPPEKLLIVHVNDAEDLPVEQLRDAHRLHVGRGVLSVVETLKTLKGIVMTVFFPLRIFERNTGGNRWNKWSGRPRVRLIRR